MSKQSRKPEESSRSGAVELSNERLDVSAGANGLFRYYGDLDGDRVTPRPPQVKAG
jgi:hypothetical protein